MTMATPADYLFATQRREAPAIAIALRFSPKGGSLNAPSHPNAVMAPGAAIVAGLSPKGGSPVDLKTSTEGEMNDGNK